MTGTGSNEFEENLGDAAEILDNLEIKEERFLAVVNLLPDEIKKDEDLREIARNVLDGLEVDNASFKDLVSFLAREGHLDKLMDIMKRRASDEGLARRFEQEILPVLLEPGEEG